MAGYNPWGVSGSQVMVEERAKTGEFPANRPRPGESTWSFLKRRLGESEKEANQKLQESAAGYTSNEPSGPNLLLNKARAPRKPMPRPDDKMSTDIIAPSQALIDKWNPERVAARDAAKNKGGSGGGGKKTPKVKLPSPDDPPPKTTDMEKALQAWRTNKGKLDLSPLMALTDSLTGSQLLKGYKAPMDSDERLQMDMHLQMKLEEHKRKIEHDRAWLKNAMLDRKLKQEKHDQLMLATKLGDSKEDKRRVDLQIAKQRLDNMRWDTPSVKIRLGHLINNALSGRKFEDPVEQKNARKIEEYKLKEYYLRAANQYELKYGDPNALERVLEMATNDGGPPPSPQGE